MYLCTRFNSNGKVEDGQVSYDQLPLNPPERERSKGRRLQRCDRNRLSTPPLQLSWPEHVICNLGVVGSNPTRGSLRHPANMLDVFFIVTLISLYSYNTPLSRPPSRRIVLHPLVRLQPASSLNPSHTPTQKSANHNKRQIIQDKNTIYQKKRVFLQSKQISRCPHSRWAIFRDYQKESPSHIHPPDNYLLCSSILKAQTYVLTTERYLKMQSFMSTMASLSTLLVAQEAVKARFFVHFMPSATQKREKPRSQTSIYSNFATSISQSCAVILALCFKTFLFCNIAQSDKTSTLCLVQQVGKLSPKENHAFAKCSTKLNCHIKSTIFPTNSREVNSNVSPLLVPFSTSQL